MEATFLFLDMAGFTALTEAHGDEAAADLIGRFQAVVGESARDCATVVDSVADGAFLAAAEPGAALCAAQRLWSAIDREPAFPAIRAGLHHGEAVQRGGRYFGTSVNIAARVTAQARGDEVLATRVVADAAIARGMRVDGLGPMRLRNLSEPVEVFAVELRERSATMVVDPVCRMKLDPREANGELRFGGRRYWFCSLECSGRFARDPAKYASAADLAGSDPR
jgi:adenylate cyclase